MLVDPFHRNIVINSHKKTNGSLIKERPLLMKFLTIPFVSTLKAKCEKFNHSHKVSEGPHIKIEDSQGYIHKLDEIYIRQNLYGSQDL